MRDPAHSGAVRTFLGLLPSLEHGKLELTTPEGDHLTAGGKFPGPAAQFHIRDWRAVGYMLRTAEIGLAEAYRDGLVETPDLTALLLFWVENAAALQRYFYAHPWASLWLRLKHWARANTRRQARRNIAAHYDLSNTFYALWLDRTMTYSSALFAGPVTGTDLAAAQEAKYARVIAQLGIRPGDEILEIGCGWGGFAEHAARLGARVTGLTLSPAQLSFARERIERAGLSERVSLELKDYRDEARQFDHVVSIEMFEAVGERYWQAYFERVSGCLRRGGKTLIQAIIIDEAAFPAYRRSSDFIREYIFPGGMLAPLSRMRADAQIAGLALTETFSFGRDYAHTLALWRQRVDETADAIRDQGFSESFLRLWRFYLSYCEAGFLARRTDVHQLRFARQ